ncbi:peptide chain release factor N(5)-glutamine methyltransferase [Acetobacteraceae bacterium]|nr:peptide chain release factor N(5)-glutamine methyltransferase [Acetobacteraceae bacterium]
MLDFGHTKLEDLLKEAEKLFSKIGMESPKVEAWWLFREILTDWNGISGNDKILSLKDQEKLQSALGRRLKREPLAYILGEKGFWLDDFKVNASTLIPRADSEALIELFLDLVPEKKMSARLLDLGTGTGCLLLTLLREYPNFFGVGTDIVPEAVFLAKENATDLKLLDRSHFVVSSWGEGIEETFDFIISNPPYIKSDEIGDLMPEVSIFEPRSALDGGQDGLDCYKVILNKAKEKLSLGGKIFFEIGEGQGQDVRRIAETLGFLFLGYKCDLAGKERAVAFSR